MSGQIEPIETMAAELHRLLEMHARHTDSRRAAEILANFETWLPRFKAVISDEYLNYLSDRRSRTEGASAVEDKTRPKPAACSSEDAGRLKGRRD